jgi:2-methylcitrate dehydratase
MTEVEELASFVVRARYELLSPEARQELKIRVLDALGCAIGALGGPPIERLRAYLREQGGNAMATLIGGGQQALDRVAFYNSALVRYLDFNDSFLARKETCHPSDNVGAVLAAGEYAHKSGKDFLTGLAVAYQIQCRLSEVAPVRARGFDHTTQGAYAVAAGVAWVLGLDERQTASALAISGTTNNALRVTRTGSLSNWKGLAYPYTAFSAINAVLLAKHGITGPAEVFEGNKGFKEAIAGPFTIDWSQEDLEIVRKTSVKKYSAEFHSQSALEGLLELRERESLRSGEVEGIEVEIFDVAYHIIGGGEEGKKDQIRTKEEADHSLPYMLAVALLDGEVTPRQYLPERIQRADVQELLRKISIRPAADLSERFPREMPCRIQVLLKDGRRASIEEHDFTGFYTHPLTWEQAQEKFTRLAEPSTSAELRERIIDVVEGLEEREIKHLTSLLDQVSG